MAKSTAISKKAIKETEKLMKEFLKVFELEAEVDVESGSYTDVEGKEEEYVSVDIQGDGLGVLIGYMGRNLRSFQKISGLVLNRRLGVASGDDSYVRVIIDVSGYREKREESLERLAEQVRSEVQASGEAEDLSPMTSYERRVIHTHLGEYDDVTTESFGEGRDRFVRVFPVGGEDEGKEEKSGDDSDDGDDV